MTLKPATLVLALALGGCAHVQVGRPPSASVDPPGTRAFYTGKTYGSEAQFNPLSTFLNEGFDVLQMDSESRLLFERDYATGWRTIRRTLSNPGAALRKYDGTWQLLRYEILPLSGEGNGGGAWTGNWGLHFMGSGMVSARMREWYEAHGVPYAGAASALTMYATHFANEINEAAHADGVRRESLPDLLLFDWLGIAAFSSAHVRALANNQFVQVTNWPLQPGYNVQERTLENVGQYFVIKAKVPGTTRWSVFTELGLSVQGGISYEWPTGDAVTAAMGPSVRSFTVRNPDGDAQEVDTGFLASLYWDHDESLLTSVVVDLASDRYLRVNVYPGVLRIGGISPGVWLQGRETTGIQAGVAARWGVGLAR